MYKKILIGVAALAGLISFGLAGNVWAHTLATDGDMTVTMHIDPDDNPVTGQSEKLIFIYQDADQRFKAQDCNCVVTVDNFKDMPTRATVLSQDNYFGETAFTFSSAGGYQIRLTGNPKIPGEFKPFNVYFGVNVASAPRQNKPYSTSEKLILSLASAAVFAALACSAYVFLANLKRGDKK